MKRDSFKQYKKKSGTLIPFSLKKDIPFQTKRIFIIYGNKNFIRGNHAHHKCSQYLVPVLGKMEVEIENAKEKTKNALDNKKKKGLLLKPKTWCKIKFFTNNSILLVFCNKEYEYKDYIENYKEFLKIIKKK
ncbi:FdtA/QdtA family cupin domain-containing protein [Candidatus Pelagibacter sp.]|jgi:UDP-2-acetamido-3-amino-2,3-dideoxy-glucuronate N-acetyltransferase|nr:FdtA/QdtA family cupin domain-containing protein [Candidatus Pelagibacter sp.]